MRSVRRCTEAAFSRPTRTSLDPPPPTATKLDSLGNHAERVERLLGSLLLRRFLRRTRSQAELCARDMRRTDEPPVVGWAFDLEHGVAHLRPGARQGLLELGLVVDVAGAGVLDPVRESADDRGLNSLEPVLEIDGGDRSLEHRCEHIATPRDPLELVGRHVPREVEETIAEAELLGDGRTALARDHVRADLGQPPFRGIAEAVEDRPCDRELEDAVAEKLEPLVRLRAVFCPRRVGEDVVAPSLGELVDQAAELVRAGLETLSPGAR